MVSVKSNKVDLAKESSRRIRCVLFQPGGGGGGRQEGGMGVEEREEEETWEQ